MTRLTTRKRLETQGFLGLDDRSLAEINYWLRLSPAICMLWAAVGTALNSASLLWALVPFALLGAILPGHPFDVVYTTGSATWFMAPGCHATLSRGGLPA